MIGIIGAMQEEIDLIIEKSTSVQKYNIAKKDIYKCVIANKEIVVALSGIGKVNAAMTTQILISNFNVNEIINTGVAGGLDSNLNLMDIIVADDLIQHDVDALEELGQIPRMDILAFPTNSQISDSLVGIATKILGENRVKKGRVASGDQFISDFKKKCNINILLNSRAVEMEGAAIAHVCYLNDVPCGIIRCISDNAGDDAMISYEELVKKSAEISSKIVFEFINLIE